MARPVRDERLVMLAIDGLAAQMTPGWIRDQLIEHGPVKKRTADRYIQRARAKLQKLNPLTSDRELPAKKNQMRATFSSLMSRAAAAGKYAAANRAAENLCKLDGLYAPTKVELEPGSRIDLGVTLDIATSGEKRNRLGELLGKVLQGIGTSPTAPANGTPTNGHGNGEPHV